MRILLPLIALPLAANPTLKERGFDIIDQVCVEVEGATILKSEIKKREKLKNLDFFAAKDELVNERLMWVMAKKQLKYNVAEINNMAQNHAEKVMKEHNLDREKFTSILMKAPYEMSYSQYVQQTADQILENQFKSTMAAQVSISDDEVKAEVDRIENEHKKLFDTVFISVLADKSATNDQLTSQFKRAKEIGEKITATTSLDQLKRKYLNDKSISITGPFPYQKGELKKIYDEQLIKDSSLLVTKPFNVDGAVTMIWKVKKPAQKIDTNVLEKVRKGLYEREVAKNVTKALEAVKGISTVTTNCGK